MYFRNYRLIDHSLLDMEVLRPILCATSLIGVYNCSISAFVNMNTRPFHEAYDCMCTHLHWRKSV